MAAGYECGLVFEKFNDLKEDDEIEAYIMVEVPRKRRRGGLGPPCIMEERSYMRKNSIKNTRINMEVQRELSEIIRSGGIKDPRIHSMTSVVSVEVTPDLKFCKAYISVLGDADARKSHHRRIKERRRVCAQGAGQKG